MRCTQHCGFTMKSHSHYIHNTFKRHLEMHATKLIIGFRLKWKNCMLGWQPEREKRRKEIKTVTIHWKICWWCFFSLFSYCCLSQLKCSLRWFTIAKCTCMHDSVVVFFIHMIFFSAVLFTAIITVFFTKRHHKHCTMQVDSIQFVPRREYKYLVEVWTESEREKTQCSM